MKEKLLQNSAKIGNIETYNLSLKKIRTTKIDLHAYRHFDKIFTTKQEAKLLVQNSWIEGRNERGQNHLRNRREILGMKLSKKDRLPPHVSRVKSANEEAAEPLNSATCCALAEQ